MARQCQGRWQGQGQRQGHMIMDHVPPDSGGPLQLPDVQALMLAGSDDLLVRQAGALISLFRIWARARDMRRNPLPDMSAALAGQDTSPELAPACHSLFELTEACIGRKLAPAGMAAQDLSADELALLALVEAAPKAGTLLTEPQVPHGLPGALQWAASAATRAIGGPLDFGTRCSSCPFNRTA